MFIHTNICIHVFICTFMYIYIKIYIHQFIYIYIRYRAWGGTAVAGHDVFGEEVVAVGVGRVEEDEHLF